MFSRPQPKADVYKRQPPKAGERQFLGRIFPDFPLQEENFQQIHKNPSFFCSKEQIYMFSIKEYPMGYKQKSCCFKHKNGIFPQVVNHRQRCGLWV